MLTAAFQKLADAFERMKRFEVLLLLAVLLLYAPSLSRGFFIDDYRNLRLMRQYHEGRADRLDLYRFLQGAGDNPAQRAAGYYPWWVGDDVRYQHARPLSERWLYLEYLIFGDDPLGYRVMGLALYAAAVLLALKLFRAILIDERMSRWAALCFAVVGRHAAAATFVSMQCDLLCGVLILICLLALTRYLRRGDALNLAACAGCFGLALATKEAALPIALAPPCLALVMNRMRENRVRVFKALAVMGVIGAGWLGFYASGGYGANNSIMLDPLREPGHYLSELPVRVGLLLATWLNPISPFLLYLRRFGQPFIPWWACLGAVSLLLMIWLWRCCGRPALGMAAFTIVFLPLLACTVPDDRNLLLPDLGLAMLSATWITLPRRTARNGIRALPTFLFIFAQIPCVIASNHFMKKMEDGALGNLEAATRSLGHLPKSGDFLFFVNIDHDGQLLFPQHCLDWLQVRAGRETGARVAFLCDVRDPKIERVDERTLRVSGQEEPLLAGFVGMMGRTRLRPPCEGDVYYAGEFEVKIVSMRAGDIWSVEARFRQPLESEQYHFFRCNVGREPVPYLAR